MEENFNGKKIEVDNVTKEKTVGQPYVVTDRQTLYNNAYKWYITYGESRGEYIYTSNGVVEQEDIDEVMSMAKEDGLGYYNDRNRIQRLAWEEEKKLNVDSKNSSETFPTEQLVKQLMDYETQNSINKAEAFATATKLA